MTGMNMVTGMTSMTLRGGVTVMDRVTRMTMTVKDTCFADGKNFQSC